MVERRLAKAKVAGSIPVSRSFYLSAEARKIRVSAVFMLECHLVQMIELDRVII